MFQHLFPPKPNQITGEEFLRNIKDNPAWAATLKEPTEVTTFCDATESGITHLSPLLTFTGIDDIQNCALFENCDHLKTAEGTFHGYVSFANAPIEEIKNLTVIRAGKAGNAASFHGCEHLKVATGTYQGYVSFTQSGVQEIKDLQIQLKYPHGQAANFTQCKNLKVATGTFPGFVNFQESGIEKCELLTVTKPDLKGIAIRFMWCPNLKKIRGSFQGKVEVDPQIPQEYKNHLAKKALQKGQANSLEI